MRGGRASGSGGQRREAGGKGRGGASAPPANQAAARAALEDGIDHPARSDIGKVSW